MPPMYVRSIFLDERITRKITGNELLWLMQVLALIKIFPKIAIFISRQFGSIPSRDTIDPYDHSTSVLPFVKHRVSKL